MTISRSELYKAVWHEAPPHRLCERLGLSNVGLAKLGRRLGVPMPYAGFWVARANGNEPPILSLVPGPDVAVLVNPDLRGARILPHDPAAADPLVEGPLARDLDVSRRLDPRQFVAFWFECGTQLLPAELIRLDWSHVRERKGRWLISGPLGRCGQVLEVVVAPRAVEALRPFRKRRGPVLVNADTDRKRVAWLLGPRDWRRRVLELRSRLGAAPVNAAGTKPARLCNGRNSAGPVQSEQQDRPRQCNEPDQISDRTRQAYGTPCHL